MRKQFVLGLAAMGLACVAVAEQAPPTPPQAPAPAAKPDARSLMRSDTRRHDMHSFAFRMDGPDDAARILPPGAWWKDQDLAKRIELTPDQQKRIDDAFLQNKITLIHMHASLEEEELLLGPMLDANPIDQGKALAQISKIADTRADLEKANAKMLLQIRGVLNQAQWTKLQQERPGPMRFGPMRPMNLPGPHSFNLVLPNMDKLQAQLKAMPPIDAQKMQQQIDAAMKAMPPIDMEKFQKQWNDQLKALPPLPPMPQIDPEPLQ